MRPRRVFIGTSGWNYKHWAGGVFYPPGLKPSAWLKFYVQKFDTVEVNNTFYNLPEKRVFEAWYQQTPADFAFTVKASRFITHMKKLKDIEEHAGLFLERASGLKEKLRVVLFQLPPFWKFNLERLTQFCSFLSGQSIVPGLRTTVEFRNATWLNDACFETLRRFRIGLAFTDWPSLNVHAPVTADFVFVRRHGSTGPYSGNYSDEMIQADAGRIRSWQADGHDVYIYYNNDWHGFAVQNAAALQGLIR